MLFNGSATKALTLKPYFALPVKSKYRFYSNETTDRDQYDK